MRAIMVDEDLSSTLLVDDDLNIQEMDINYVDLRGKSTDSFIPLKKTVVKDIVEEALLMKIL